MKEGKFKKSFFEKNKIYKPLARSSREKEDSNKYNQMLKLIPQKYKII